MCLECLSYNAGQQSNNKKNDILLNKLCKKKCQNCLQFPQVLETLVVLLLVSQFTEFIIVFGQITLHHSGFSCIFWMCEEDVFKLFKILNLNLIVRHVSAAFCNELWKLAGVYGLRWDKPAVNRQGEIEYNEYQFRALRRQLRLKVPVLSLKQLCVRGHYFDIFLLYSWSVQVK